MSALLDKLRRCNDMRSLEAAFMSTLTGQIVTETIGGNNAALHAITMDLVQIKISCKMRETVLNKFASLLMLSTSQTSVVDMFQTVIALRPRLQLCVSLFNLVPELAEKFVSDNASSHDMFSLDMCVLHAAFSQLDPKVSDMLSTAARQDWSNLLMSLSAHANHLEGLVSGDQSSSQLMTSIRKLRQRAEMIKLFFDIVLQEDVSSHVRETVCQHLRLLFSALRDPDFVSGSKTFNNVKQVIDVYCKKVGEALLDSKGIRECIICQEAIQMPVILTCGHVACQSCLQDYLQMTLTRTCYVPTCQMAIPDGFRVHSVAGISRAEEEHAKFRKNMTQFFIELLQCHIFVENQVPNGDIVQDLVTFIVTKQLPKDNRSPRTKQLSPFPGDLIDPQPVIRSFLLQLILRYDTEQVEGHLQQLLLEKKGIAELKGQFHELCSLIITCTEDKLRNTSRKQLASGRSGTEAIQHMSTRLDKEFHPYVNLVRSLIITAHDRLAVNTVGQALHEFLTGAITTKDTAFYDLMKIAEKFVHHHPQSVNLKRYLARFVAAKYQQNAVIEWKRRDLFRDLLPEDLRNASVSDAPDVFLILDRDYQAIRNTISQAWLMGDYTDLTKMVLVHRDKTTIWSLAFHTLTRVNPCCGKNLAAFNMFLRDHSWLQNIWISVRECHPSILVGQNHRLSSLHSLLIHIMAVVSDPKLSQLLHVLRQLAQSPENCQALYLPTMPQDETLEAKAAVTGLSIWFQCPNGHAYVIGKCGRPLETSKCPDCGSQIGREGHNQILSQLVDSTRLGHLLGEAAPNVGAITVREIGGLDIAVIRLVLHVAMLAGSIAKPDDVRKIISPRPVRAVEDFLTAHLLLNLTQICDGLGRCEDDVIVLLHQIVDSFAKQTTTTATLWSTLDSKAAVRQWEKEFVRQFIRPALADLDIKLAAHETAVKEDKRQVSNVLLDILFEEPIVSLTTDISQLLSLPQLWQPSSETITIARLESKLGGAERFKDCCPILFHLVKEELRLREVVHLPELLQLARFMVANFSRKFEPAETAEVTVEQFLMQHCGPSDRDWVLPLVGTFFAVFHRLKAVLFSFQW